MQASCGSTRAGRFNAEVRYQRSGALLESERDLIQSAPSTPFDLAGNVGASPFVPGAEIDPALSAAAGTPVTVAAVPASAATGAPALADFVPGANRPNVTDLGRFRTLLPQTDSLTLNATLNRTLLGVSATFNARVGTTSSESRLGLPSLTLILPGANPYSPFADDVTLFRYSDAAGPLLRETRGRTAHGGLTLAGDVAEWRWTFTANYDFARSVTLTDSNADPAAIQARLDAGDPALNPFAPIGPDLLAHERREDRARSTSQSADAQVLANGNLFRLPAGEVIDQLHPRRRHAQPRQRGDRAAASPGRRDLSRHRAVLRAASTCRSPAGARTVLAAIGNLSPISISSSSTVRFRHSDHARLRPALGADRGARPRGHRHRRGRRAEHAAARRSGGGHAQCRIFDFVRGETVDVTRIDGGNPALIADSRHVFGARASFRLLGDGRPGRPNLSINANYTSTRITNPIASFPVATAEIEAAFPGPLRARRRRAAAADRQPAGQFRPLGPRGAALGRHLPEAVRPAAAGGPLAGLGGRGGRGPGARRTSRAGRRRRRRGPRRRPGAGGGGRRRLASAAARQGGFKLSLFHTWRFTDEVLIRPGVPVLDYLNGSAFNGRGGRPRHEIEAQAGYFQQRPRRLRARRLAERHAAVAGGAGRARAATCSSPISPPSISTCSPISASVRRWSAASPGWRARSVQFGVTNLFDAQPRVRDETGATPLSYQPDYLDPLGRSIRIGIRKLF